MAVCIGPQTSGPLRPRPVRGLRNSGPLSLGRIAGLWPAFTRPERGTPARLKLPLGMNALLAFSAAPVVPTCKRAGVPRPADNLEMRRPARESVSAKLGRQVDHPPVLDRRDISAGWEACHAAGWQTCAMTVMSKNQGAFRHTRNRAGLPERVQAIMALAHSSGVLWPTHPAAAEATCRSTM